MHLFYTLNHLLSLLLLNDLVPRSKLILLFLGGGYFRMRHAVQVQSPRPDCSSIERERTFDDITVQFAGINLIARALVALSPAIPLDSNCISANTSLHGIDARSRTTVPLRLATDASIADLQCPGAWEML